MIIKERIKPFKGVRFNPQKINLSETTAPPYDVISDDLREKLYNQNPFNIVRIDYGKGLDSSAQQYGDKYKYASFLLNDWLKQGILIRDERPCYYGYKIKYCYNGVASTMRGIFCLYRITNPGDGMHPHEATHSKPKEDRLNLMRACLANTSPIYALYRSKDRVTSQIINHVDESLYETAVDINGHSHMLCKIDNPEEIVAITDELNDKEFLIADGHHRYDVSVAFKNEMDARFGANETNPWNYTMIVLTNIEDDGITVLPTFRLLRKMPNEQLLLDGLAKDFEITKINTSINADFINRQLTNKKLFILYTINGGYLLRFKHNAVANIHPSLSNLDVVILQEAILKDRINSEDIAYDMSAELCINNVNKGVFEAAIFFSSITTNDIEKAAISGVRMPPKSTYFYPKLMTGLVINKY